MTRSLSGRNAIVFGGGSRDSSGWSIGKACALAYARAGARVMVADIDEQGARNTAELIASEGFEAEAVAADVCRSDSVEQAIAAATRWGSLDILHNNVGITAMGDPVEASEESWHRVMDINATGPFLTCKHALPHMLRQGHGVIINISSTASIQVNSYPYFSYYASKAALNHFTRALAVHYAARGIRANAILPGVMDTPLIYRQISGQFQDVEEMRAKRNAASPMGRMGDAWDIANAAVFLAGDEANYITGVCLPVDGGKSCAGK